MLDINSKIKFVLNKISLVSTGVIKGVIVAFTDTIEVVFSTVGDLLGVLNDNINRVKGFFSKKP